MRAVLCDLFAAVSPTPGQCLAHRYSTSVWWTNKWMEWCEQEIVSKQEAGAGERNSKEWEMRGTLNHMKEEDDPRRAAEWLRKKWERADAVPTSLTARWFDVIAELLEQLPSLPRVTLSHRCPCGGIRDASLHPVGHCPSTILYSSCGAVIQSVPWAPDHAMGLRPAYGQWGPPVPVEST